MKGFHSSQASLTADALRVEAQPASPAVFDVSALVATAREAGMYEAVIYQIGEALRDGTLADLPKLIRIATIFQHGLGRDDYPLHRPGHGV